MPRMLLCLVLMFTFMAPLVAEESTPDFTCFQAAAPWSPELDMQSDVAVVYGVNGSFLDRLAEWRRQGYSTSLMTGISWGNYEDYYQTPDGFKKGEVQTDRAGKLFMHGNSTTVGYNVPTDAYVEFIKERITPAIDAGVRAVYLEEPEFWARTGWSDAFKELYERRYAEPWVAPSENVDYQWRASQLKYELYYNALEKVFRYVKERGAEKGYDIECHVPTHSLINYAHWRIISPESSLMQLDCVDGYIAQVWTGTARTPNIYQGVRKERTFETAYLEYGQMLGMVRPTGRKVWFLHDPIEDNPNYSWNDYRYNYQCTVIASLLWPEVHRYEVMPWPSRIFRGQYLKTDNMDEKSGERTGIPADYATEILTVINALNEMNQPDVERDMGTAGIGVVVSDTMMFQRAQPYESDPDMGSFHALALPLLKQGVPVEVVQLENVLQPNTLPPYKLLLLTYEGQKPLKPEYNEAMAQWVRDGGLLLYVGDGEDPYNRVRAWWNEEGKTDATARDDLFARLGLGVTARNEAVKVGEGAARIFNERPRRLQNYEYGGRKIRELVQELLDTRGETLATQRYLKLRRGPFVIVSVLDESVSAEPVTLEGHFVDLFDSQLPCVTARSLAPNERTLLYDLDYARGKGIQAKVAAAGARISDEDYRDGRFSFDARGPLGTTCRARILLPSAPREVLVRPETKVIQTWDEASGTLFIEFANRAEKMAFTIQL